MSIKTKEQKIFEIAIGLIPGVGNLISKQLLSYCGSAENIFKYSKPKLLKIPNIGDVLAKQILESDVLKQAEKELEKAEKNNIKIIFYTDEEYPQRLKRFADSPTLLYMKGNTNLNPKKSIGIVGTRNATEYGKEITEQIIKEFSEVNPHIISGLAYGIDIAAHKSALKYDLPTIGVMASGIDIIYPSVHKSTALEMQKKGAIITENAIGTIPDAPRFPARNRIIAGLSDIIIVVEAAEKGGALITAEIANDYGVDVYAVPGKITDKFSMGCNKLISSNKAAIFRNTKDLLELLGWNVENSQTQTKKLHTDHQLEGEERKIYELIFSESNIGIDELAWKAEMNINKISNVILQLEFKNIIKTLPGKKFKIL
ncbi:MAG: DNA-protecting protein DprA [Cytophagales bacterium]|nr:MAG: DNA-protecting protein DprA [Cytophagales bacterium]TAG56149.1 MAG: DNA-protecting protein DprA [Cytophagales bacterium]